VIRHGTQAETGLVKQLDSFLKLTVDEDIEKKATITLDCINQAKSLLVSTAAWPLMNQPETLLNQGWATMCLLPEILCGPSCSNWALQRDQTASGGQGSSIHGSQTESQYVLIPAFMATVCRRRGDIHPALKDHIVRELILFGDYVCHQRLQAVEACIK